MSNFRRLVSQNARNNTKSCAVLGSVTIQQKRPPWSKCTNSCVGHLSVQKRAPAQAYPLHNMKLGSVSCHAIVYRMRWPRYIFFISMMERKGANTLFLHETPFERGNAKVMLNAILVFVWQPKFWKDGFRSSRSIRNCRPVDKFVFWICKQEGGC